MGGEHEAGEGSKGGDRAADDQVLLGTKKMFWNQIKR